MKAAKLPIAIKCLKNSLKRTVGDRCYRRKHYKNNPFYTIRKSKAVQFYGLLRHIKDGFVENQWSKSNLIAAIHSTLQTETSNRIRNTSSQHELNGWMNFVIIGLCR
jgi:hypothetical protein